MLKEHQIYMYLMQIVSISTFRIAFHTELLLLSRSWLDNKSACSSNLSNLNLDHVCDALYFPSIISVGWKWFYMERAAIITVFALSIVRVILNSQCSKSGMPKASFNSGSLCFNNSLARSVELFRCVNKIWTINYRIMNGLTG